MMRRAIPILAVAAFLAGEAHAAAPPAYSCGGFAQMGGAQLLCSHVDPQAPAQICTFSWTLASGSGGPTVVQGSFLLSPGQSNVTVYQGSGFAYTLGNPIVLCQSRARDG